MSSENEKKIVVTGAGGFLGGNLVEMLKDKEGYFVFALSSHGEERQQADTSRNIQYCYKDIIFSGEGERILNDAIVVNCAFPRNSTGTEMAEGLWYIQRLFGRSKECKVKAIINISSQSVYSQTREGSAAEETPVCLESPYAVGKYAAELMLESVCQGTEIVYTNLRMASLIGPGFDQRIVNRFVKQALTEHKLTVDKSKHKFGFLDIADAAEGIFKLLQFDGKPWDAVYNLGIPDGYSLEEIARCVASVTSRTCQLEIKTKNNSENHINSMIDCRKFYKDFLWQPKVSLELSVKKILKYEVRK
jgi:Nucleoside-diphosphate-sugar epimerases